MILSDIGFSRSNGWRMSQDDHHQDSPKTAHKSQTTDQVPQRARSGVAVVYDDLDFGFILARTLEKMGHQVESVSYKTTMLGELREGRYRLAILEVKMADGNGLGRLEAIRETDAGLPVILVTGPGDSIGRVLRLGVEGWIEKPFRLDEVRIAVKQVLG